MKLNTEQQQLLRQLLRQNLRYHETFAEFYDHVLTALETKSGAEPYDIAVTNIINEDFGGLEGMRATEKRYSKSAFKALQRKYFASVMECFHYQYIGYFIAYAVIIYPACSLPKFGWLVFIGTMAVLTMSTRVLKLSRYFKTGYHFKDTMPSIKDIFYNWLRYIPGILTCVFFVVTGGSINHGPVEWLKNLQPAAITVFLTCIAIHTFSFYRVYKYDLLKNIVLS